MKLIDRLNAKRSKMQKQMRKGMEVTEQMKAEKKRKRLNKMVNMKPGARQAVVHGIVMKRKPLEVMREEYDRRRSVREQKRKEKE